MLYLSVLGFLLFLFAAIASWIIAAILSTVLEISILDMWWSHWWLHLGPSNKNQYSQRFWTAITLVPFIYAMKPHVICKGTSEEHAKQKKDVVRLCNAEKDLPKVNSTVVFLMHSDRSGLWILANCRYVIIFSGFEKNYSEILEQICLLLIQTKSICTYDALVHMHGLWKSVKCVISAPLLIHCMSVSWIVF